MRYDLSDLQLFSAIALCGSLTQAAARVHLSPASASARIRRLEGEAGCSLFERHARGLSLTLAGEAMQRHARQVLAEVVALDVELGSFADQAASVVRLFANTNALGGCLPQDLASFLAAHPQIDVLLEELPSSVIVRAVSEGVADVGIVAGEVAASDLSFLPYRRDQLVLICPRKHPLAQQQTVKFIDTVSENYISLDSDSAIHAFLLGRAREVGRRLRIRAQVRGFDAVCRMVAAGVGVALVPRSVVDTIRPLESLCVLPLVEAWAIRQMKLCFRREQNLSPHQRELILHLTLIAPGEASSACE